MVVLFFFKRLSQTRHFILSGLGGKNLGNKMLCGLPLNFGRLVWIDTLHHSDHHHSRLGCCGEQAVLGKKFDHKAIKKPRLLHLTGVAGSRQDLQLAIGYTCLKREGSLMGAVLAPGQDHSWTGDALMMAVLLGFLESFELVQDRLHISEFVAFGEKVREEM